MLIYVHGFNSGGGSSKAGKLRAYLAGMGKPDTFFCPDLPHRPAQAIGLLSGIIQQQARRGDIVKLAGSSLGGFYATWLAEQFGLSAILINPAVHAQHLLADELGEHKNYSSGEIYQFTQQHLDELAALDLPVIRHPEKLLLMVETGDEVLDYRIAVAYYAESHQIVVPGGDHGFRSFEQHISTLIAF